MKNILLVAFLCVAFSPLARAESGQYVCSEVDVSSVDTAPAVAKALNSLKCDTSKPTNVAYDPTSRGSILVCCVQK
jgi:hypothetical protein